MRSAAPCRACSIQVHAVGSVHRLAHGLPDFGTTISAFVDEVDFGHAPVRFDVAHIHGQHSHAAWTDDRRHLDFVVVDKGWHIGSPLQPREAR
jgi:hypothetical protein